MIETDRLLIKPLSGNQLKKYVDSSNELSLDMGLKPSLVLLDENVKEAIRNDLLTNIFDENKDPLFYTMWLIIKRKSAVIIGAICFHGEPDDKGEVEIGYGTDEPFQNLGYMSETIAGLAQWIFENKKAQIIKAETECDNIPSISVLEKNGFKITQQTDSSFILKLVNDL
jgi:[ribosomal protein S5]-alanine N-acetyltransferase